MNKPAVALSIAFVGLAGFVVSGWFASEKEVGAAHPPAAGVPTTVPTSPPAPLSAPALPETPNSPDRALVGAAEPPARPTPLPIADHRQLDETTRVAVNQMAKFAGIEVERLTKLAATDPARHAEFTKAMDEVLASVNALRTRLHDKGTEITEQRLAAGRFEQTVLVPNNPGPPKAQVPGEIVRSGVYFDKQLGKSVRRVVRIYPGEDAAFDEIRTRLDGEVVSAKKIARDLLSSFGY